VCKASTCPSIPYYCRFLGSRWNEPNQILVILGLSLPLLVLEFPQDPWQAHFEFAPFHPRFLTPDQNRYLLTLSLAKNHIEGPILLLSCQSSFHRFPDSDLILRVPLDLLPYTFVHQISSSAI